MIIVETMLPLKYNDGTPIPRVVLDEVLLAIAMQFGGYTLSGEGQGFWIGPTGKYYIEPNKRLSFACNEADEQLAHDMVQGIGRTLNQESMYFVVHRPDVTFIEC